MVSVWALNRVDPPNWIEHPKMESFCYLIETLTDSSKEIKEHR